MQTSIDYEKNVLNSVVNDFTMKCKFYENIIDNFGLTESFVGDYMFKSCDKKGDKRVIWYGSNYFFRIVDMALNMPEIKTNGILKKIVRETIIFGFKLDDKKNYIDKLLNLSTAKSIDFIEFINKYGLDDVYFLEYFFACIISLMMISLGEIKNFKLFDLIVRVWTLFDNMVDRGENKEIVRDVCNFLEGGYWKSREGRIEYFEKKVNPILECFGEMEVELGEEELVAMYKRFWKLYKFDYRKRIKSGNILKYSCLRKRKFLDIFMFALNTSKKDIQSHKYYNYSLLIQLFDNLMNIRKDIKDNNTIFLKNSKKENTALVCALIENFRIYFGELDVFFEICIMLLVIDNEEYFLEEFTSALKNSNIINTQNFNMQNIYKLVSNISHMKKLFNIYLS